MTCTIRNYESIWSDARFDEEAKQAGTTLIGYDPAPGGEMRPALLLSIWLSSDEAKGWCYFANRQVLFSHAPTAVAFKMRFG